MWQTPSCEAHYVERQHITVLSDLMGMQCECLKLAVLQCVLTMHWWEHFLNCVHGELLQCARNSAGGDAVQKSYELQFGIVVPMHLLVAG